jgi:biopolymer transport protein ExbB
MSIIARLRSLLATVMIISACSISLGLPLSAAAQAVSASTVNAPVPTAEAPAAAAAPTPMTPATVKVDNPYGLDALWETGDFVAKGTLVILLLMSISTWYVMISKLYDQHKMRSQAKDVQRKFWQAKSVQAGSAQLQEGSAFRYIADTGIKSIAHHDGALLEQIDLNSWVTLSIQRAVEKIQSRLQDGLALLATVGSTAPFIGLFGTVWGIYHALTAIGVAGQASIDKVAGPVGEALIMTAIGLAVAVPAVLGYNWLVRRNKGVMEDVRSFSTDLHAVLLSGVMSSSQAVVTAAEKKVA